KAVEVALAQISKNPVVVPKHPAFPVHPGEQTKVAEIALSSLPQAGSAFPAPAPKAAETAGVTDGKFSALVGRYDGGQMGMLVVRQEGDKLFALDPGGQRIELVPEAAGDKFVAQPVGGAVSFEKDTAGKVTAIVVTLPDGRIVKGRRAN
ncbi:MAG TPA: hypothetical protein VFM63_07075, partial [Pyrinomonadaceae bacterium]|nr:hypothetical protein [Pyrinomonadaceae bacterium]